MANFLKGTGVALVTPFDERQEVDYEGFRKVLAHTQNDVDFWVLMGTTGESATCSEAEKDMLLEVALAEKPSDLPLVYGLGGNNTRELLATLKKIDVSGIKAFLSVSPYYNKPSQEGIFQHFTALADASPRPLIIYNVPPRTASNIKAETTLRLAEHPNIIGIKEASGDLMQAMEIIRNKPKDFVVLSGDDALTVPLISVGAEGVIAVIANAFPKKFSEMTRAALAGDFATAREHTLDFAPLYSLMFAEGNPSGIKQTLNLLGVCSQFVRSPLTPVSNKLKNEIKSAMAALMMVPSNQ